METHKNVSINWELEIEQANHGFFSMSSLHNLVLSYSQEDENCFHDKGKLVKIEQGKLTNLFETKSFLKTPVVDENQDVYVCTHGYYNATRQKSDKSTLLKINPAGGVVWEYLFDTVAGSEPVIFQDSILVYDCDYMEREQRGNLLRFSKDGNLIWKKPFVGPAVDPLLTMKTGGQEFIILSLIDTMLLIDMNGSVVKSKEIGHFSPRGICINDKEGVFVCVHPYLIRLNNNLDIIWTYKPENGSTYHACIMDSEGNLYCLLSGCRMVSLDNRGKERWVVNVTGDVGYQPIILTNGEILTITSYESGKKAPQIEDITYLEIFSPKGTKLFKYELPGYVINTIQDTEGTIFLDTGCRRVFPRKHQVRNSIKVFSISIS